MPAPKVDAEGFKSPATAATQLQAIIEDHVRKSVKFPTGLGVSSAQTAEAILALVDAKPFGTHNGNEHKIVEARAVFKASNSAGKDVFELEIIWDADTPPEGSKQTAHYGWEIYLDKTRVAGPGHVFFVPGTILPNYRIRGLPTVEDPGLRLTREGKLGNGKMVSVTRYFRLDIPKTQPIPAQKSKDTKKTNTKV